MTLDEELKHWPSEVSVGIDEAGRGPLAGPVIAAAVILPAHYVLPGLNDSKKISQKQREKLYTQICDQAVAFGLGRSDPEEIDAVNILQATLLAMQRAVAALSVTPKVAWVDGSIPPQLPFKVYTVVGGDSKIPAISAASILAKVTRDTEMETWHETFPQYNFATHKGYPTKAHVDALLVHGPCSLHRRSFAPVRKALNEKLKEVCHEI